MMLERDIVDQMYLNMYISKRQASYTLGAHLLALACASVVLGVLASNR